MPILKCPHCSTVIAWLGKSLAGIECPGEHPDRFDAPLLHVDRDHVRLNGDGIDVSLSGTERREQAAEAYERWMERWVRDPA